VTAIPLGRRLPGASSNLPGRLIRTDLASPLARRDRAVPIRSCSRWGLPCRSRCRSRGALLPHRFTLASPHGRGRRSVFCGTFPGLAPRLRGDGPAGRYPAPLVHGARTFLHGHLSAIAAAAVRPTDTPAMGSRGGRVKGKKAPPEHRRAPVPRNFRCRAVFPAGRRASSASIRRPHRRCAPGGNAAGRRQRHPGCRRRIRR
jgi:hypothetical protein